MAFSYPDHIIELIKQITQGDSFVIVSHENPDGDSIGSQFALAIALKALGKNVEIQSKNHVPKIYNFLHGETFSLTNRISLKDQDILIVLDCSDLDRTGFDFSDQIPSVDINIDHHISNTYFGTYNWVDTKASATAEIIYHLLLYMGAKITSDIASNIYTAISTDTGSFQYSNTTSETLRIASDLVEAGADSHEIALAVYDRRSASSLRLIGIVLNEMENCLDNRLSILVVTKGILEQCNATYEDTEDLVALPQKVTENEISVLIKEIEDGEYKISIRTKRVLDASKIARRFGGGGHHNAAGAKQKGDLATIKSMLVEVIKESLNETSISG